MGDGELVWEAGTAERPSLYCDETLRFVLRLGLILNGSVFCATGTDGALRDSYVTLAAANILAFPGNQPRLPTL